MTDIFLFLSSCFLRQSLTEAKAHSLIGGTCWSFWEFIGIPSLGIRL